MTDIGAVTRTLKKLVEEELKLTTGLAVTTTAAPLEPTTTGTNLISCYLYYALESPELKNAPPIGGGGIQQAPMGLILQYILTALHQGAGGNQDADTLVEQNLMGAAARAIHDFPIITKDTVIVDITDTEVPILDPELAQQNNKIELNLRPAPSEETVTFWSTETSRLPRLSLFVEARVVVLEPKQPTSFPGIVLSVGSFVFPSAGAQLTSSQNALWFVLPESAGGIVQQVKLNPAQVALHPDDTSALGAIDPRLLQNNRLTLTGVGLAPQSRFLILERNGKRLKIALDTPDDNPHWEISLTSSKVEVSVRRHVLAFVDDALAPTDATLEPGSYTARVVIEDPRFSGKPQSSSQLGFSIVPQILSVAPKAATPGTYRLVVLSDYLASGGDILLGIGGNALSERPTGSPSLQPGQFEVVSSSIIELILATGASLPSAAHPLSVRFMVNGVNATPAWLEEESV
jgi:hypothetical protein